jgi:predicted metal-dependent HD superfamily phosphohydrolase
MENLLELSEKNVVELYETLTRPELLYHNLVHTREVVDAVQLMRTFYLLPAEDDKAVAIAAWWHDVGYLFGPPENHESLSAQKARDFLSEKKAPESLIAKVESCIMATKMPQKPNGLMEEIISDADLFHLGTAEFKENSKMLRREIELIAGNPMKGSDWRFSTINLLERHHYFTGFAQERLNEGKHNNLVALKAKYEERLVEKKLEKELETNTPGLESGIEDKKLGKQKIKIKKGAVPKRGIETMFRLTSRNHMELSGMADSKANIMISVNAIIISVVLSLLLRRLEDMPQFLIPTLILLVVNITTIIFAVLATRPNTTKGYFTREDIHQKKVNLLFFGNFHRMGLDDFHWGMNEMMKDPEYLYSSMIRDIYFLGKVLGKKYQLLRISYSVFMFGIILAVLSFAVVELIHIFS